MAGKSASILIKILGDATGLSKEVGKATSTLDKVGAGFRSALVPATVALGAVTAGAFQLRDAAEENVISNSRLEQVFRSMGDTTGAAAKQAEAYSDVLSKQIGVEDDTIKATQAKLATFAAVSNETARQAGIFDRATAAAADLASAGFGSMDTNATQLGKALQDPVKGLTALAKSGVTFTDQQKEQIKTLVESGRTLDAQKIILGAIEQQVGGVATATATSSAKQAAAWDDVQEALGAKLLPLFDKLTAATMVAFTWIGDHAGLVVGLGTAVGALSAVILGVNVAMTAWTVATKAWAMATKIGAAVQAGFNLVMAANPIVLIVLAIAALVAGLIYFFTQTELGKEVWANVWGFIQSTAQAVAGWFTGTLVPWFQAVWAGIQAGLAAVGAFFTSTWNAIVTAVQTAVGFVLDVLYNVFIAPLLLAWQLFWGVFGGVLTAAWELVVVAVTFAVTLVQVVIFQAWNFITTQTQAAWSGFMFVITAVWDALVAAVTWYVGLVWSVISFIWNAVVAQTTAVWATVSGAVVGAWNGITGAVSAAVNAVQTWIGDAWARVKQVTLDAWAAIPSGVKDKIGEAVNFVRELPGKALDALGDIGSKLLRAGGSLIQGFIDGITRSFGNVKTTLQDLTNKLTSWKGPADRDATLLTGAGQLVIDGFIAGLESRYGAARASLSGFTDSLQASGSLSVGVSAASSRAADWVDASSSALFQAASPNVSVYVQAAPDKDYIRTEALVAIDGASATAFGNSRGLVAAL